MQTRYNFKPARQRLLLSCICQPDAAIGADKSAKIQAMLLEGLFAPVTTPFYADGAPFFKKLEHNVDRYSRTPIAGLVVLGSTGEAVMLSDAESREVLAVAAAAAAAHKVLVAGVGRESVAGTLTLAEQAAELRYDAVLVRTPYFYRPQMHRQSAGEGSQPAVQREMLTYYRAVADRSPLPVLLYSIPACTGYDLPVDVIAELAQHSNIIGLKDSSGNVQRIAAVVERTRDVKRAATVTPVFAAATARMLDANTHAEAGATFVSADSLGAGGSALAVAPARPPMKTRSKEVGFQVLAGSAQTVLASLQAGAAGAILGFADCAPQACYEVLAAWKDRDADLSREKQERIAAAARRIAGGLGIAGIKFACDLNGYYGGSPRLPLLPLTAEEKSEVAVLMEDMRN